MMPAIPTIRVVTLFMLAALLQACAGSLTVPGDDGPPVGSDAYRPLPPDPVPRHEPRSRYGNPRSYEVFGRRYHVLDSATGYVERGVASWYGSKFHGRRTSSGETYDMHAMTAAHRSLPLPTYVRVTNLDNGRSAVVRVNDRGPFHENRIIDLSYSAARRLGILGQGTGLVEVRALGPAGGLPPPRPMPAVLEAPAPRVEAPAPRASASRLFLQVGAFAERENAERLRTRIASIPDTLVVVEERELEGRRLFRVRIGPLADVDRADRLSARLVAAGIGTPRIVIE